MKFSTILKQRRKELNLTQQELADQLHVTRQTLSRWENNLSYPNLDTLVELSNVLNLSLDNLLTGENNTMVQTISNDVRNKKRYKLFFTASMSLIVVLLIWLGFLGYGRATQNGNIDHLNPFLTTQTGYALLPDKVPEQKKKIKIVDNNGVTTMSHWENVPQKIDTFVLDNEHGNGSWNKIYTGKYKPNQRYAIVEHKGAYISQVRVSNGNEIPTTIREELGTEYRNYNQSGDPTRISSPGKSAIWWLPFS